MVFVVSGRYCTPTKEDNFDSSSVLKKLEVTQCYTTAISKTQNTGGDNTNKRCFGTKPKLFRESGDFSGNGDT